MNPFPTRQAAEAYLARIPDAAVRDVTRTRLGLNAEVAPAPMTTNNIPKKAENGCCFRSSILPSSVVPGDLPGELNSTQQLKSMFVELDAFFSGVAIQLPLGFSPCFNHLLSFANQCAHVIKGLSVLTLLPGKTDCKGQLSFEAHIVGLDDWMSMPANGLGRRECLGKEIKQPCSSKIVKYCIHTGRYRRAAISIGEFDANRLHEDRTQRGAA